MPTDPAGCTVWFTGLSGAGKSTLAQGLREDVCARGRRVEVLDGDEMRTTLCRDLGFTRADRDENIRRIGFVAQLLARHAVIVLVAAISPYREARASVRAGHVASPFVEVYVECPLVEVMRRDTRGLYARAQRGEVAQLTGLSDPYEAPLLPDVHVRTDVMSPGLARQIILAYLDDRSLL